MKLSPRRPLGWSLWISLALFAGTLSACGGGGGFRVDEHQASLQTESANPHETIAPPADSSDRIDTGDDPETRENDPIFHLGRPDPKQPGTGATPSAPQAPPTPSQPGTVGVDPGAAPPTPEQPTETESNPANYALPQNTFATVRVRLFPIVQGQSQDVYLKTADRSRLQVSNGGGLRLRNLGAGAALEKTGNRFEFLFRDQKVIVDGQAYPITNEMSLALFPVTPESPSAVNLNMDVRRLQAAKVALGENGTVTYRGIFLVKRTNVLKSGSEVDWALINYVQLEDYIRGVVPSEIGGDFLPEAIKAQALAARTYTLRNIVVARCSRTMHGCTPRDWDVDPSTQFQSYVGAGIEKTLVTDVVNATRGQYIKFNGAPILAMYHSSSGGKTRSAKDFFCKAFAALRLKTCADRCEANYPYLKEVVDTMNGSRKRFGHGLGLPQWSAQEMAKAGRNASDIVGTYYPGSSLDQIKLEP